MDTLPFVLDPLADESALSWLMLLAEANLLPSATPLLRLAGLARSGHTYLVRSKDKLGVIARCATSTRSLPSD